MPKKGKIKLDSNIKLQKISLIEKLKLIPLKSMKSLKGSTRGIDKSIAREKDRI